MSKSNCLICDESDGIPLHVTSTNLEAAHSRKRNGTESNSRLRSPGSLGSFVFGGGLQDVYEKWANSCATSLCKLYERKIPSLLELGFNKAAFCQKCTKWIRDVDWTLRQIELMTQRITRLKSEIQSRLQRKAILGCLDSEMEKNSEHQIMHAEIVKMIFSDKTQTSALGMQHDYSTDSEKIHIKVKELNLSGKVNANHMGHHESPKNAIVNVCNESSVSALECEASSSQLVVSNFNAVPIQNKKDNFSQPEITKEKPMPRKRAVSCIKCSVKSCSRKFWKVDTMEIHIKRDHQGCSLPFTCKLCNKSFRVKGTYMTHLLRHEVPGLICEVCGRRFTLERDLKSHILTMHSSRTAHSCKLCCMTFTNPQSLNEHHVQHKLETTPFTCVFCNQNHANSSELQIHTIKTHVPDKLRCGQCGKTFWTEESLRKHLGTHKVRNPKYTCLDCGYIASSNSKLSAHLKKHSSVRDLECNICGTSFKYKKSLARHLRGHSNETPYECSICGKGFKDLQKQKRHEEIHSGNKYPCPFPFCGKEFHAQQNLKQHYRIVHIQKQSNVHTTAINQDGLEPTPSTPSTADLQIEMQNRKSGKIEKTRKTLKSKSFVNTTRVSMNAKVMSEMINLTLDPTSTSTDVPVLDNIQLSYVEALPTSNPVTDNMISDVERSGFQDVLIAEHETANTTVPITITDMQNMQIVDSNYYF